MIRSIIKLGVLLVVGIIGYNYFLGTPDEKESARETIGKVREVVGSAIKGSVALLKKEREKFREGKYDEALSKVGGVISEIKDKAEDVGGDLLERANDLEEERELIKKQLEKAKDSAEGLTGKTKEELAKDFEKLTDEAEEVLKDLDKSKE